MIITDQEHRGRPGVRTAPGGKHVVVLCPVGHLIHSIPMREWAGSIWEARAGDPTYTVSCDGTLPS